MKNILVTGGAGYIGSHTVRELRDAGHTVWVYDNLSEGHKEALVPSIIAEDHFIQNDINDAATLDNFFSKNKIDVVMHFCAHAYVGESVVNPEKYYKNNVAATLNLLGVMKQHNVNRFIFSSSCATYGEPKYIPIDENHPQDPISPYGETKYFVERILKSYSKAYGLNFAALRYFNAAGAHPDGSIGESHRIETHLIPLVLKTLTGEKKDIIVFGSDYETADGTCIRDYIHVCDLAAAHRLAMEYICSTQHDALINLGTGSGVSVKEVISICEKVTGKKVPVVVQGRRVGDPAVLTANSSMAERLLGFKPAHPDIHDIIKTAWYWEQHRRF
ncbi:MAG: UDP-glucose 4-epimerase GalE [Termitinemataceae bacterium]|nr:MAG: UDP-glucose 4-epimerase GalE [Termitinemataceae bacterium]